MVEVKGVKTEFDPSQPLSEETLEQLAAEGIREADEAAGLVKPEPEPIKDPEPEPEPEKEEEKEPEPEEDSPKEPEKEEEEEPEKEPEKDPEEEPEKEDLIRSLAIEEGLTIEEATELIDKRKSLVEKYTGDTMKMAKAIQSSQRAYDKLRQHVDENENAQPVQQTVTSEQIRQEILKNQEVILKNYKTMWPAQAENLTDEAILEIAGAELAKQVNERTKAQAVENQKVATKKREELISGLSEADRQFAPDVKHLLDNTYDAILLNPDFDVKDSIFWAKGKYYDSAIKKAREQGIKEGKEQTKIVGEIPKTPDGANKAPKKSLGDTLSEKDKTRALSMMEGTGQSEEEIFKWYIEEYVTIGQKAGDKK